MVSLWKRFVKYARPGKQLTLVSSVERKFAQHVVGYSWESVRHVEIKGLVRSNENVILC